MEFAVNVHDLVRTCLLTHRACQRRGFHIQLVSKPSIDRPANYSHFCQVRQSYKGIPRFDLFPCRQYYSPSSRLLFAALLRWIAPLPRSRILLMTILFARSVPSSRASPCSPPHWSIPHPPTTVSTRPSLTSRCVVHCHIFT